MSVDSSVMKQDDGQKECQDCSENWIRTSYALNFYVGFIDVSVYTGIKGLVRPMRAESELLYIYREDFKHRVWLVFDQWCG